MASKGTEPGSTSQRLLDAACRTFAKKGFHETTIAEICDQAGANIASVNYYFRSKENLYVEAWQYAFETSVTTHPADGRVPPDAPPDERLRGRIRSVLERIADPECWEIEIVHKEMANPTGLLTGPMHESTKPVREGLRAVVRELLGGGATEQDVHLCTLSLMSQCFGPILHERRRKTQPSGAPLPPPLAVSPEEFADHVLRFSLAGIREVRREIERRQPTDAK